MTGAPFTEPILHVDMDAFYVEVERLDDPSLRDRPVAVGGTGRRSVVASASYEAREFGVRSAMPTLHARRLCPALMVVAANHRKYAALSERVFAVLRSFTPWVEGLSLDEAFMDVRGLRLHYESPVDVADAIRRRLRTETLLPSSVGVAANKLLAKLASVRAKPDGVYHVPRDRQLGFLHGLDVRALWGVGEATYAALEQLGVGTVGDLAAVPSETLRRRLGPSLGEHLHRLAWGRDDRPVVGGSSVKSLSSEQTYDVDLTSREAVERELLRHCDRMAARLRRAGLAGRTLSVKIRYHDFETRSRSSTLAEPTNGARDLFVEARRLLMELPVDRRRVRLVGVSVSRLKDRRAAVRQLAVDRAAAWDEVADAVDEVRARFGRSSIGPARLAGRPEVAEET
jgi:DNA polymerase-4